ncbi:MAG TPA: phosphatidate cytidylyltransferase [Burkholderiales bacterium]|nr:phosphatidate cytidylyltransferase [Burkholderiales bacterium]
MLATRLATAVALLAAFVAALFWLPNRWWTAVLLVPLFLAGWEWAALAGWGRAARWAYCGALSASALLLWLAASPAAPLTAVETVIYGAGCAFWLLVAPVWIGRLWRIRSAAVLAPTGFVVLLPAWLALARLQAEPGHLLAVLAVVWLADSAAYLVGSRWGRHRLAPAVSPGKSWEGVAGAAAAAAVYYAVLSGVGAPWTGSRGAVLVAAVAVASVVGDLFESWLKRQAGVKDSGALLPGHGGVLDRTDSLLSSLPFAALILAYPD